MTQFRKKPVVITAITFDQLVAHGIAQCKAEGRESNIVDGMPRSFSYGGHPIKHESGNYYLIPTLEGTMRMGCEDMLITGVRGEIYPCKRDIFDATYEAAPKATPAAQGAALTDSYVQQVPDKCDRIVWRGSYYHLPTDAALASAAQPPIAYAPPSPILGVAPSGPGTSATLPAAQGAAAK